MSPPAKLNVGATNAIDRMPQDILAAIGEIILRWGYLQFQVGVLVREASGIKDKATGRVLTVGPDLGALCNQLRTLTHSDHWIKDETIRGHLAEFADDVRKESKHRNDYAHGIFGYDEATDKFVRFLIHSSANRVSPGEEPLDLHDLKDKARRVSDLWLRAEALTRKLKALRKRPS